MTISGPKFVLFFVGGIIVVSLGLVAWSRMGMLNLPRPPADITAERAGLANLDRMRAQDYQIRGTGATTSPEAAPPVEPASPQPAPGSALALAQQGYASAMGTEPQAGLAQLREALTREPDNLVFSNAYRMAAFSLQRAALRQAAEQGQLSPELPAWLKDEPIASLKELAAGHPSREMKLSLAMAWIDHMLLYPALEIKAPSSVEAVEILTGVLRDEPGYVPALFARGLNHLHRPKRLVWPKADEYPPDAAAQDIGMCVSIGQKLGGGSPRLRATLALALGDAYVKDGKLNLGRSWWQLAQNLCRDADFRDATRRRFSWRDAEILDRVEEELDRARLNVDTPMTDLAMMWR